MTIKKEKMTIKKENSDSFKDRLSIILTSCAIGKKQLAALGHVSPSSLTKYLKGESNPSQETLAYWASALDLNLNWLLLGEGHMYRGDATPSNATPEALDKAILLEVLETLEEYLHNIHKRLPPKAKADLIYLLYQLVIEEESGAKQNPIRVFRMVQNVVANA